MLQKCITDSTVMHEFIHAIGFYHEQSRPDRDKFVKINKQNISPNSGHNFKRAKNSLTFGVPYDGLSIMHYSYKALSKSGKPSIESKVRVYFTLQSDPSLIGFAVEIDQRTSV